MNKVKLYQRTKTGKIGFKEFWTDGPFLCSIWGTTCQDPKMFQTTKKECLPMNIGKANATSGAQQAITEMEAKIVKNKKRGYVENIDDVQEEVIGGADNDLIDLNAIPQKFVPCKPKKGPPKSFMDNPHTYGQKKRNGHCIILVKAKQNKVYSRTMEDITEYLCDIPEIIALFAVMQEGSMLLTEFCFVKANGKDSPRTVGKLVRKKDYDAVMERYAKYSKIGKYEIVPFDTMFNDYKFIGALNYMKRYDVLKSNKTPNIPENFSNWRDLKEDPTVKENWEGWVLRNDKLGSQIHYTMNGKADAGGSFKIVYTQEDDFIVTSANKGKAGMHTGLYAQFTLEQIMKDGKRLSCGNCGPGKFPHDELKNLTKEIDSGELTFPFVVQVEYRSIQPDSGKLEFAQLELVRYDKTPEECITDFTPDLEETED